MQNDLVKKAVVIGVLVLCLQTGRVTDLVGGDRTDVDRTDHPTLGTDHEPLNIHSPRHDVTATGVTVFHAPYYASSGQKDDWGEGLNFYHDAYWAAWQATGYSHISAETRAVGDSSSAYAQATVRIFGPQEGAFQPESSGKFFLMMVFLLTGEVRSAATSGGKATVSLNLTGRLENMNTNQTVGSSTRIIYYGVQTYRSWSLRPFVILFSVNLSMTSLYQFSSQLSTQLTAHTERLLSNAEASSSLTARLMLVLLLPSK